MPARPARLAALHRYLLEDCPDLVHNLQELFRPFYFGRMAHEVVCYQIVYDCQVFIILGLGQKTADYRLVLL